MARHPAWHILSQQKQVAHLKRHHQSMEKLEIRPFADLGSRPRLEWQWKAAFLPRPSLRPSPIGEVRDYASLQICLTATGLGGRNPMDSRNSFASPSVSRGLDCHLHLIDDVGVMGRLATFLP